MTKTQDSVLLAKQVQSALAAARAGNEAIRQAIGEIATTGAAEAISVKAQELASGTELAEWLNRANQAVEWAQKSGDTTASEAVKQVLDQAIDQVAYVGADDTWSGRGNDLRRAKFEGLRLFIGRAQAWTSKGM